MEEKGTIKAHTRCVLNLEFSSDSTRLASTSQDNLVKVWEPNAQEALFTLRGHNLQVSGVAFSPDGKTLASSSDDSTVRLWDMTTTVETVNPHSGSDPNCTCRASKWTNVDSCPAVDGRLRLAAMSTKSWDHLPPDTQDVFRRAAESSTRFFHRKQRV
eukprot:CAMPEP_0169473938 /NCGR_PEP_ID=MMETSP1042-20121227/25981_1 /TAXON_ID=464988 /ORGANISM="Hemiselmis andersenii, Strain CCMP1180" /LENGTH=157 /DNA_ID=CAMNT_0009587917 /DNA_START=56 /DNA_END=525 /DNA_ORIENTATION=+